MKYFFLICSFFLSFLLGCSSSTSSSSSGTGTVLESKVKATAPNLTASSRLSNLANDFFVSPFESRGDTWTAGSGNYEIFNLLRDYDDSIHNGVLDMTNMYKALYEAKIKIDELETSCTNSFAEKAVASPFTGFTNSYTYTCGVSSGTMSDTYAGSQAGMTSGGIYHLLYGFLWGGNQSGGSVGVIQSKINTNTKAINYEMVNCVNCGAGSSNSFTVRTDISGDFDAHTFTVRTITRTPNRSIKAIVGKGTSQGTGAYMLFKYYNGSATKYYCMASNATETEFRAATGADTVSSDCSSLESDVSALTMFTSSDAPFALSDFTGSSILLSY